MMTRRIGITTIVVAMTATSAWAQPWFARGGFNGWAGTAHELTEKSPGHLSVTITGLTWGDLHEYKITVDDWSSNFPGSNGRVAVDVNGEIRLHFFPGGHADGWQPKANRVGYDDHQKHGWGITGDFNGWAKPGIPLTKKGNGIYSGKIVIDLAGKHDFKFLGDGAPWAISIGDDFGNAAANNSVTTTVANQAVTFLLDLPNGRWRVVKANLPTINELRIDSFASGDDEYFELCCNPGADLGGLTFVSIGDDGGDGSGANGKRSGVIEKVCDLTGMTCPASGYFLAVDGATNSFAGIADLVCSIGFENSDNMSFVLVTGFTGATGDVLDTDRNGTIDVTPWTAVVDSVSLIETTNPPTENFNEWDYSGDPALGSPPGVGPDGSFVPGQVRRCADCDGPFEIGSFSNFDTDTPGAKNSCCPDGVTDPGEDCDDANTSEADLCKNSCEFTNCGDGIVQNPNGEGVNEVCDDGMATPTCDTDCTLPLCGDGVVNPATGEECDDGNTTPGDGCSADCENEAEPGCLMISELADATLPGGLPKFVEITNCGCVPIDLSAYSLGNFNNGGTNLGGSAAIILSGILAPGDSYVTSWEDGDSAGVGSFFDAYGFDPDHFGFGFNDSGTSFNGDDVIALFFGAATGDGSNATLLDVYGVLGVDGTGSNWEYKDSYSFRNNAVSSPSAVFNVNEWTIPGLDALEAGCGFDDVCELANLLAATDPGTHAFHSCCLLITEVVDATLPGGLPKFVELTAVGCPGCSIDLSAYSLGNFNNGGLNLGGGAAVVLSGILVAGNPPGNSYITSWEDGDSPGVGKFFDVFGFDPDHFGFGFNDSGTSFNGDDVIALFLGAATGDGTNATLVDVYGVLGVDGTGSNWEYKDGYSNRNKDVIYPTATFDVNEWFVAGLDALEAGCGFDDVCEEANLVANTDPGSHTVNLPNCCFKDVDCGKCETCDPTTSKCVKDVPNCCSSDAQCPGKCQVCDLATNTCFKAAGCCTTDSQCGKCETCDLATNTCNKDVPNCCTIQAQCTGCETCDLDTNTCVDTQGKCTGCEACVNGVCEDNQAKCVGCEACVNGVCVDNQAKCIGCETCLNAVCVDNQAKCPGCEDCVNAVCVDNQAKCPGCQACVNAACVDNDAKCAKCETCTAGVCNKDVPGCCSSDAQCDDGDPCTDDFCALASNTCVNTNVCGSCCLPDRTCAENFREADCLALSGPGNFLGIKAPCRGGVKDCLPVPTVSEWGMAALAVLLLIGLTVKFRRRSTTTA
ncbi:MAG: IPTL-CTERM sorting domain-containing protein [Phycisphaerae bacterium]